MAHTAVAAGGNRRRRPAWCRPTSCGIRGGPSWPDSCWPWRRFVRRDRRGRPPEGGDADASRRLRDGEHDVDERGGYTGAARTPWLGCDGRFDQQPGALS